MRIEHILIHNFRGIIHQEFFLNPYTLLIGGNNAGKSTVVDAIRAFYEKDSFSYKEANDFPQKGAEDKESWIEVTFVLSDEEYSSLADTYKYASNKLKVRKYFKTSVQLADGKTAKGAIVGYKTDGTISNEHFYGAKNVQTGKLGNIIYIPAISKVDDFTKLSGPSALRDLITNIMSGVI
ncbi:MAG: AAA family ATPase, partial [Clostridia bacterium]|nr:AAA family ATPase [Clostridia bacterium]